MKRTGVQVCEIHAGGRRGQRHAKADKSQMWLFESANWLLATDGRGRETLVPVTPECAAMIEKANNS
jgi:hypothetical protein